MFDLQKSIKNKSEIFSQRRRVKKLNLQNHVNSSFQRAKKEQLFLKKGF